MRLILFLLPSLALAQTPPKTWALPGNEAPFNVNVQGSTNMIPVKISGTVNSAGVADTVGSSATYNANSVCGTVALAGQTGAGFSLASGTLVGTFTPSVSNDATVASPNCSGGTWTATKFVDSAGNTSSTISVTNPNAAAEYGIQVMAGARCARVCTTAYTSGSATGFVVASYATPPPPAAGADVTDRAGRLLGQLTDGASAITPTKTGQLPTALDGSGFLKTHEQGTAAISAASLPLPTGAATAAKQPALGTAGTASSDVITVQGITSMTPLKVDGSGVTQPVSGTFWQATQPVSGTVAATESGTWTVQPGNTPNTSPWLFKLNDGTNSAAIKAASTAAGATDPALVVAVSPNNSVAVTGTFWQSTQPVSIAGNQAVNVAQVGGSSVSTAAAGVQKVGVTGNSGAAMDAAGQNAASPANELVVGGQFNTTPTTITTGNVSPLQLDSSGNLLVNVKAGGGGGGPSDAAANAAASESDTARQKVTAALRLYDTGQGAGSQLVTAKGDQTSGLWVNCKAGCSAAGDTTGAQQTLSALNNAATVALAGENSVTVQLTSSTSPVFTLVGECSLDGGSTYGNTAVFVSSTGTTATLLSNPANATYSLVLPPGCSGATNARVRVSAYTSGSIVAQLRATSNSPASAPYAGAIGTTSYPPAAVAIMAQDSSTATTSRAVKSSANGLLVDGSGVTQPVSGTVTANAGTGTFNTSAAQSGTWTVQPGNTANTTPWIFKVSDGTNAAAIKAASTATTATDPSLTVALSPNSPLPAGTNVIGALSANQSVNLAQVGGGAVTTVATGEQKVGVEGLAANGATSSGNPVRVGGIGRGDNAAPTQVTAGQASDLTTDLDHRLWVREDHPNRFTCSVSAASTETQCQAAPGSGNSLYVTDMTVSASAAITIQLTTGTGTNCATGNAALSPVLYFAANSGTTKVFAEPLKIAANTALCCKPSGASGSCWIQGFTTSP